MNSTSTTFQAQPTLPSLNTGYSHSFAPSSKRESLTRRYQEDQEKQEQQQNELSEREKYIAACKRLLSGLRKCQEQPQVANQSQTQQEGIKLPRQKETHKSSRYEQQMEDVQFKDEFDTYDMNEQVELNSSQTSLGNHQDGQQFKFTLKQSQEVADNSKSLSHLEKMIDDWELLYQTSKAKLYTELREAIGLEDKKQILDEFFSKLENEEQIIKTSQVYRAFKTLHSQPLPDQLSTSQINNSSSEVEVKQQEQNLQQQEKLQQLESVHEQAQRQIQQRRKQLRQLEQQKAKKSRYANENSDDQENTPTGSQKNDKHKVALPTQENREPTNLFREVQNSTDLSPNKKVASNGKDSFDPKTRRNGLNTSRQFDQENNSPIKKQMPTSSLSYQQQSPVKKSPMKRHSPTKQPLQGGKSPLKKSPTKRHSLSNLENQENQENIFGGLKSGSSNLTLSTKESKDSQPSQLQQQLRRKKSERNRDVLKTQSQSQLNQTSNEEDQNQDQSPVATVSVDSSNANQQQNLSQEALKERQALKDTLSKSLFKNQAKHHRQQTLTQLQQELLPPPDITKLITVDSQVINYGRFICGKILGSTLLISNISNQDQIIEITIDAKSQEYPCDEIFGPYQRNELPFEYKNGAMIKNSEIELESWFIENPISKDLVKSLTFRISPQTEKEFIIVVKAPHNRLRYNLASFLIIKHAQNMRRHNSSTTNPDYEIEKRLTRRSGSQVNDPSDIEIELHQTQRESAEKQIKVMLLGRLENPQIECVRELYHEEVGYKMLPLCVKKSQPQQKFRIPFKNMSLIQDADIEFTFVKMPRNQSDEQNDSDVDLNQYLEFYCQPSNLKLPMNQQGFLNVLIKVDTNRLNRQVSDEDLLRKPVNKLLVGRLKDTSVIFSYFISISMVNQ